MDIANILKCCEDYLFPAKKMTVRERVLYYYLFRHTRLLGKENGEFAIAPLASALNIAESSVREDVRSLHARGCICIEKRSRTGHVIRVLLPEEIDGIIPTQQQEVASEMESLDFFTGRKHISALLVHENGACFYCLRRVCAEDCELDHVAARMDGTDNSYMNIVASCHECNTTKQAQQAADFIRSLYRRGILSQPELERRLSALEELKAGRLVPNLEQSL
jgi:5-methylcytosine-specific restriction endonuclease McrA